MFKLPVSMLFQSIARLAEYKKGARPRNILPVNFEEMQAQKSGPVENLVVDLRGANLSILLT